MTEVRVVAESVGRVLGALGLVDLVAALLVDGLLEALKRTESHAEVQLKRFPQEPHLSLPSESKDGLAVPQPDIRQTSLKMSGLLMT